MGQLVSSQRPFDWLKWVIVFLLLVVVIGMLGIAKLYAQESKHHQLFHDIEGKLLAECVGYSLFDLECEGAFELCTLIVGYKDNPVVENWYCVEERDADLVDEN